MLTHIYNFTDDRAILDNYFAHNHNIYSVPVAIANDDIPYSYRVDTYFPNIFNFWGKIRTLYTVALGDNKTYLAYAQAFGAEITKHPYNDKWKMAEFTNEIDAYTLTKFIAIQETMTATIF